MNGFDRKVQLLLFSIDPSVFRQQRPLAKNVTEALIIKVFHFPPASMRMYLRTIFFLIFNEGRNPHLFSGRLSFLIGWIKNIILGRFTERQQFHRFRGGDHRTPHLLFSLRRFHI
jgi:hypothetical protein